MKASSSTKNLHEKMRSKKENEMPTFLKSVNEKKKNLLKD